MEQVREACRKDHRSIYRISQEAGVACETMYAFMKGNHLGWKRLVKVAKVLGLRITVEAAST